MPKILSTYITSAHGPNQKFIHGGKTVCTRMSKVQNIFVMICGFFMVGTFRIIVLNKKVRSVNEKLNSCKRVCEGITFKLRGAHDVGCHSLEERLCVNIFSQF